MNMRFKEWIKRNRALLTSLTFQIIVLSLCIYIAGHLVLPEFVIWMLIVLEIFTFFAPYQLAKMFFKYLDERRERKKVEVIDERKIDD